LLAKKNDLPNWDVWLLPSYGKNHLLI
jgi:hypothetical protein